MDTQPAVGDVLLDAVRQRVERFVYAPGLPFLEALLPPEQYRVRRLPIAGLSVGGADVTSVRLTGGNTLYAAVVRRLEQSNGSVR